MTFSMNEDNEELPKSSELLRHSITAPWLRPPSHLLSRTRSLQLPSTKLVVYGNANDNSISKPSTPRRSEHEKEEKKRVTNQMPTSSSSFNVKINGTSDPHHMFAPPQPKTQQNQREKLSEPLDRLQSSTGSRKNSKKIFQGDGISKNVSTKLKNLIPKETHLETAYAPVPVNVLNLEVEKHGETPARTVNISGSRGSSLKSDVLPQSAEALGLELSCTRQNGSSLLHEETLKYKPRPWAEAPQSIPQILPGFTQYDIKPERDKYDSLLFSDRTFTPSENSVFFLDQPLLTFPQPQLTPLSSSIPVDLPLFSHIDSVDASSYDYQQLQYQKRQMEAYILHLQAALTAEQARAYTEQLHTNAHRQIIISNTTEVIAGSKIASTLHSVEAQPSPFLEWWLRLLASRRSQCFLLGGAILAVHLFRQRLHHSWRVQNIQVRTDVSILLRLSRIINASFNTLVGLAAPSPGVAAQSTTSTSLSSLFSLFYPRGFLF